MMNILRKLSILACFSAVSFYASVDDFIRQNEIVIEILQKHLDSMRENGEAEDRQKALQNHFDELIQKQNKLLEQKATGNVYENSETKTSAVNDKDSSSTNEETEARARFMAQEELQRAGLKQKSTNPYDDQRTPTPAEVDATKKAEDTAPELPEGQSAAMAQYELALNLFKKGSYKQSAAAFGRIVRTYPKDPLTSKALVHIAFCLEKQGNLENAATVCEEALKRKLDDVHQVDCQVIRVRNAKSKGEDDEANEILKEINTLTLTNEQKQELGIHPEKPVAPPAKPKIVRPANLATAPIKPKEVIATAAT